MLIVKTIELCSMVEVGKDAAEDALVRQEFERQRQRQSDIQKSGIIEFSWRQFRLRPFVRHESDLGTTLTYL
jgi:hypothetical protein